MDGFGVSFEAGDPGEGFGEVGWGYLGEGEGVGEVFEPDEGPDS